MIFIISQSKYGPCYLRPGGSRVRIDETEGECNDINFDLPPGKNDTPAQEKRLKGCSYIKVISVGPVVFIRGGKFL